MPVDLNYKERVLLVTWFSKNSKLALKILPNIWFIQMKTSNFDI